jgi:bifunctional DNase/RNase
VRILLLLAFLSLPARAEDVKIESTEVRVSSMGAAVLLRAGNKAIPVFVDPIVAESIQAALERRKPVRPLTHDLMHNVLAGFDGRVTRVVVTLKDGIYYGALTVAVRGTSKVFDSRSSDAIALAVHFGAPIIVSRELLDSAGIDMKEKK